MEISKATASWVTACQETSVALATFNVDFSLLKVEAPEEFKAIGKELTSKRVDAAENGMLHVTARKLGALFQHSLPRTPHLIKAYGTRASEIASCREVNPKPSSAYGIFADHAGLDGTSLWAAATSGPDAVAMHLLACLLARIWPRSHALAIWTELVAERKRELENTDVTDPFYHISQQLSRISLTSDQLADWDASTRGWLQGADEAMGRKHVQLKQVVNNTSLDVNSNPSMYKNVVQTWTRAMEVADSIIQGQPHSVHSGAVLLGLSSWHIYPDMIVLQDSIDTPIHIQQHDDLVNPGGLLTAGLQIENGRHGDHGICWSLSLGHLRYYGGSIVSEQRLSTSKTRVSPQQLLMVAVGCLTDEWGLSDLESATIILKLWEYLESHCGGYVEGTKHWLGLLAKATEPLLGQNQDPLESKQCQQLLRLGRRRVREFLSLDEAVPPAFGLNNLSFVLSAVRDDEAHIDTCIAIIRKHVQKILRQCRKGFMIRYCAEGGPVRKSTRPKTFIYATATPIEEYQSSETGHIPSYKHHRWALERDGKWGPRPSTSYQRRTLDRAQENPQKKRRREIAGEAVSDYFEHQIQTVNFGDHTRGALGNESWLLRWTLAPDVFKPFEMEVPDEEPYVDWEFVAGSSGQHGTVQLFMTTQNLVPSHATSRPEMIVHHEILLELLQRRWLDESRMLKELNRLVFSEERKDLLASLRALSTAAKIYHLLPGATVELGVTSKPIYRMPWVQQCINCTECEEKRRSQIFSLLPVDRSSTFACIISFESGCLTINPESLRSVMAVAVEGSIYIAAPLLCDPCEMPQQYEVRKIRGSIGKPGVALLIPPQNPQIRNDLEGENWNLVNHNPFNGQLEDSFHSTTLHLWFTEYVLPIDVGNHGSKSFEIYFLESVVSVHDRGRWVADLDIIKQLESKDTLLVRSQIPEVCPGKHHKHDFELPLNHHCLTAIDDWNEILDGPEFVGIVRSHGNWLGRLATASLSSQLNYHTFVLPRSLCWTCVVNVWFNLPKTQSRGRNVCEIQEMEAKDLLGLMSGLILIC